MKVSRPSSARAPEKNTPVNPDAIKTTSIVNAASANMDKKKIIGTYNDYAGRPLTVLQDVYKSESDSNQRNQAIGALMLAYGYIKDNWQRAVDLYTRQCSIGVNAKDLGMMAATLAAGGKNPVTGKRVLDSDKVPGVLAVMATAGLYDDSGKWSTTRLPGQERRRAASSRCRREVRHCGRIAATRQPATACALSGRSLRFPMRWAAIHCSPGLAERFLRGDHDVEARSVGSGIIRRKRGSGPGSGTQGRSQRDLRLDLL
jgi:hypothetical protein